MAELILDSLRIENYRLLESLAIPRLGRVNLITGKNNVGKSSLLETLRIYANRAAPSTLVEILIGREEMSGFFSSTETNVSAVHEAMGNLFPGRPTPSELRPLLEIGPLDSEPRVLGVNPGWFEPGSSPQLVLPSESGVPLDAPTIRPSLEVSMAGSAARLWFDEFARYVSGALIVPDLERLGRINCMSVPPEGLRGPLAAALWDQIALTEFEDAVIEALQVVDPAIDRLSLVGETTTTTITGASSGFTNSRTYATSTAATGSFGPSRRRAFRVRTRGMKQPFPLRSMGDGVNRALGLSLALVNARDGLLLLDEFDNGLHYTVQLDLWRHVFRLARELNVQVFATTHSYDCVQAFQEAAVEAPDDGILIRLSRQKNGIVETSFDEDDLEIATRRRIEVR